MAKKKAQQHLPTMEPPKLPALDATLKKLAEVRGERIKLNREDKELVDEAIGLMENEDLTNYENGDIRAILTQKKKVKVRINGDEPEPDEDDDQE